MGDGGGRRAGSSGLKPLSRQSRFSPENLSCPEKTSGSPLKPQGLLKNLQGVLKTLSLLKNSRSRTLSLLTDKDSSKHNTPVVSHS